MNLTTVNEKCKICTVVQRRQLLHVFTSVSCVILGIALAVIDTKAIVTVDAC